MVDDPDPFHSFHHAQNLNLNEYRKQQLREERLTNALLGGILIGLVAGLLWEAIRR